MKPYHITSNVFNSWVDLESIQMISDLLIPSDEWVSAGLECGQFSITLAFQDKQKTIKCPSTSRRQPYGDHGNKSDEDMWAQVRAEQASIKQAYDDLLAAWKAL